MVNHVVRVVADHPTIVDLAGDLAGDMRRRRRRWRLGRHVVIVDVASGVVGRRRWPGAASMPS
jgi:hypothetical protein